MPKIFTKIMRNGVPLYTVVAVSLGIFNWCFIKCNFTFIYRWSESIFVYVYSASILPGMIPWFMILFSHLRFRKLHPEEVEGHPFKMPGGAVSNYLTILFLILVLVGMVFNVETRISVLIGVIFLTIVTIYYFIRYNKNNVKQNSMIIMCAYFMTNLP